MTKQEAIIRALGLRGFIEIDSKSRKYRTLAHPAGGNLYFIGKAGAVRVGKNSSTSYSISHQWANKLVEEGKLPTLPF